MKILLTAATGYLGKRLLPALINIGHYICCVLDEERFNASVFKGSSVTLLRSLSDNRAEYTGYRFIHFIKYYFTD